MSVAEIIDPSPTPRAANVCAHCGEPLSGGMEPFCCAGCAAAYRLIGELGLEQYYRGRQLDPHIRRPRPAGEPTNDALAAAQGENDGTVSLDLLVDGLHCAACAWLIEGALARQPNVSEARVNLTTRRLRLRWRGAVEDGAPLLDLVRRLGYGVLSFEPHVAADFDLEEERQLLRALAVAGFASGNVMLLSVAVWSGFAGEMGEATRAFLHWISALIALPAVIYAGGPFFRSAGNALRHQRTNMDVPISVGVILVAGMSLYETIERQPHTYFESVLMLLFFLLIGRYLALRARRRAGSAAELLLRLANATATLVGSDGQTWRVPAKTLAVGDCVLVAVGERIPIDGRVLEGRSAVDKSMIDGESLPREMAPGDSVLAGMINLLSPLRVTVTATGDNTFLAEIGRLMEAAAQGRARLVMLADRVARLYAPVVHMTALVTFAGWVLYGPWQQALLNAVAVLIITCPCALGLAIPAVQVVASARLMRRGVLLKSATALERLAQVDTIVFDKTGTLTMGQLELQRRRDQDDGALRLAAALAAASRHPLSQALRRACPIAPILAQVEEHPGAGLIARTAEGELRLGSRHFCHVANGVDDGAPELWLQRPGKPPAQFEFSDRLRPDALEVIAALRQAGMRVLLFSGDRAPAVAAVARTLGIDEWRADMAPAAKCESLQALARGGAKILMVGDGLNDAAALAAAYVSISPATAADVSQRTADVVFQGTMLGPVGEAIRIARLARSRVRENIALAILYNALALPLAIAGAATPLLAAIAMSTSSLIVVGNAMRIARRHA